MISALSIIGVIAFILSIVAGFQSGSFIGFVMSIVRGIASAVIFFALARIIENQENILYRMDYKEEVERRSQEKITCSKCNYKYDKHYSSCPHCGYRE